MELMRDALETIPHFLKQAAGFCEECPVVVTFYGGRGSCHLRWRAKAKGGGALPVALFTIDARGPLFYDRADRFRARASRCLQNRDVLRERSTRTSGHA